MEAPTNSGVESQTTSDQMFTLETSTSNLKGVIEDPSTSKASSKDEDEQSSDPVLEKELSIALARKVLPNLVSQIEEEDAQCCSICLDDFTQEDPSTKTTCGHGYHLQCIMQWAQRSRECPLCFHTLQLEDETMNALLPFGEYINPQQTAATAAMLENWELERFLVQLSIAEHRERRAQRSSRRRSHPAGERSEPRPIFARRWTIRGEEEGQSLSTAAAAAASSLPNRDPSGSVSGGGEFPSSWPPSNTSPTHHSGDQSNASSSQESIGQALKSKWTMLKTRYFS